MQIHGLSKHYWGFFINQKFKEKALYIFLYLYFFADWISFFHIEIWSATTYDISVL